MTRFVSLAIHAEKLHEPRIWQRVDRVAGWMAARNMSATWFVYPFRAQVAGKDIGGSVRALSTLGQEIGQHTHFYAGTKVQKPEKVNDFTAANIVRCLRRDFAALRAMHVLPQGFTSGAWMVNETVWDVLIELGFAYDCSVRFPKPRGALDNLYHRWKAARDVYRNGTGSLILLPTTCSLGEWFRWGRRRALKNYVQHHIVYLHDYDLLRSHVYCLLWLFLLLHRWAYIRRASDLIAGP